MKEDEQAFWDRGFCAAMTGILANPGTRGLVGEALASAVTGIAKDIADAALSARRIRTEKDKP